MINFNEICVCDDCSDELVEPIGLPCGHTICRKHIEDESQKNHKIYKCLICNEKNRIPKNGFKVNVKMSEIFEKNFNLNKKRSNIQNLSNELTKYKKFSAKWLNDPLVCIERYLLSISKKIETHQRQIINEANIKAKKLNEELAQCKYRMLSELSGKNFEKIDTNTEKLTQINEELSQPIIDTERLDQIEKDLNLTVNNYYIELVQREHEIRSGISIHYLPGLTGIGRLSVEKSSLNLFSDGFYEGNLTKENLKQGIGKLLYFNGTEYIGNFNEDKKHGLGILNTPDGLRYVGHWDEDKKLGLGFLYNNDKLIYQGEFRDDKRNGTGMLVDENHNRIMGYWKDDKLIWDETLIN